MTQAHDGLRLDLDRSRLRVAPMRAFCALHDAAMRDYELGPQRLGFFNCEP